MRIQRFAPLISRPRLTAHGLRLTAHGSRLTAYSLVVVLTACASGDNSADSPADPASLRLDSRSFVEITDFISGYWQRPVPLQGLPPEGFNPLEASFQPSTCGTCHPRQYEDWSKSIHSKAYSPGLSGQLVNWEEDRYSTVRSCLACHAPLSEQAAFVPDTSGALVRNPFFDRSLEEQGLICAGCHFRAWRKHGPPRRDGSLTPSPEGSPHGGVTRTTYFQDSRFCASCHQFAQPAANGKSLQNTFVEWEQSKYPALGMHCGNCHMPDRRHLWRGIHDSTMVASGVGIDWVRRGDDEVGLRVRNTGVGHRFPTYVTPEVQVRIEFLDAEEKSIPGSGNAAVIARVVKSASGGWQEISDTRLAPDSSLTLAASVIPEARYARALVTVVPDRFYEGVFAGMLAGTLSDTARVLISEAHRRASTSQYAIFDDTIRLGSR